MRGIDGRAKASFGGKICINLDSKLEGFGSIYLEIYVILITYVYVHFLDSLC